MMEQNFDSKMIRYLYLTMIITGLAFTGKFSLHHPIHFSLCINVDANYLRNKHLFVWPSIFSISSCYRHLRFAIASQHKKFSYINNLPEFYAC